jgi:hypothetical protein
MSESMMSETAGWANRIVDAGSESPEQLLANPKNWRIHPKAQQDALSSVLDRVGWVQTVVVNRATGFVLDGHLRVALALSRGEASIPVSYVDLDEAEEDLVLAGLDPLSSLAITDPEALNALLDADQDGELAALFSDDDRGIVASEPLVSEPGEAGGAPIIVDNEGVERPRADNEYVLICPECGCEFVVEVEEGDENA